MPPAIKPAGSLPAARAAGQVPRAAGVESFSVRALIIGGGGGSCQAGKPGDGGSGVVIVRYLTSAGTLTATGSYSTAVDGDYTVVTYTADGTFQID